MRRVSLLASGNAVCLRISLALSLLTIASSMAQSTNPFVPKEFKIPEKLETQEFRLRMLTVNDVVKDYDAVMTSVQHLRSIWPSGTWPEGLTLEQDLIDLGWHQKEFQRRTSFAYTVVTPSESKVVGCVYINPTPKHGYDAVAYLWARQSELESGLEARLFSALKSGWLRNGRLRKSPFRGVISIGKNGSKYRTKNAEHPFRHPEPSSQWLKLANEILMCDLATPPPWFICCSLEMQFVTDRSAPFAMRFYSLRAVR